MNTQELRNKIDSTLGNSMRVLLPSYWWKKLFHAVVEEIDDVRSTADKKQQELISGSTIKTINGQSVLGEGDITIDGLKYATERTAYISRAQFGGNEYEDIEITSDERAYNIETLNKVLNGEPVILSLGGYLLSWISGGDINATFTLVHGDSNGLFRYNVMLINTGDAYYWIDELPEESAGDLNFIRTIYDSTAEDFTEEQREYNKESYKIIMDGGHPDFLAGGLSVNYFIDGDKVAFSVSGTQCDDEFKLSFYSPFFLLADGSTEWGELIFAPEVCYLYDPEHAMIFFRFPKWGLKGIVVMGLSDVCYVDLVNYVNKEVEFMHRDKRYRASFDENYNIGTPIEIPIGGGGNITVDSAMSSTSTNPIQNKVVTAALYKKQNTLVSGENIKTINGESIIGGGDINIIKTYGISFSSSNTYDEIRTTLTNNGITSVGYYNLYLYYKMDIDEDDCENIFLKPPLRVSLYSGSSIYIYCSDIYGRTHYFKFSESSPQITHLTLNGGVVYINIGDDEGFQEYVNGHNRKHFFPQEGSFPIDIDSTITFKVAILNDNLGFGKSYFPVYIDTPALHTSDESSMFYDFAFFNEGVLETWRLNYDGSTVKIV